MRPLISDKAAMAGVKVTCFTAPPGHYAAGERGLAALPGRKDDFREAFEVAMNYADELECPAIHVMAGIIGEDQHDDAMDAYLANLAWAADFAKDEGVRVLIQPIANDKYFLRQPDDAIAVLEAIDHKNLRLLYDVVDAHLAQSDVTEFLETYLPVIGHIQIAGLPGRTEPAKNNDIKCQNVFDLLDAHGYPGWVSADYTPRAGTNAGLGWARDWGITPR